MNISIRRMAIASGVALCVMGSSMSPAWAGDQKIVNKGIGFLEGIQSKVSNESCAAYRQDLLTEGLHVPLTRDEFIAYAENNAQERRDWIEKQSGGMTPDQHQDLENALEATRPVVVGKAEECGFFNVTQPEQPKPATPPKVDTPAPVAPPAPTPDPPVTNDVVEDTVPIEDTAVVVTPTTTTTDTTTTAETEVTDGDLTGTLNQLNQNLEVLNTPGSNTQGATPNAPAAPAATYTQLLVPNPFDPAHPFIVVIPTFVPQHMVASFAHSLPAGWQLR